MRETGYDKAALVKGTLDVKYYKSQAWISLAITPVWVLMVILSIASPKKEALLTVVSLLFLLYAGVVVYYFCKVRSLLKSPELYEIYDAVALDAHYAIGMSRGAMYFDVELTDERGEKLYLETAGVFSNSVLSDRYHGNYKGKTITLLYDRVGGRLLVADPDQS